MSNGDSLFSNDRTFSDKDLIRMFSNHLTSVEQQGVVDFFSQLLEIEKPLDKSLLDDLKLTNFIWNTLGHFDNIQGLLAGTKTALDSVNTTIESRSLNEVRDGILAELEAYQFFIDSAPDFFQPVLETILFPVEQSLQLLVDLLTPFYVLQTASEAIDSVSNTNVFLDSVIDRWETKL